MKQLWGGMQKVEIVSVKKQKEKGKDRKKEHLAGNDSCLNVKQTKGTAERRVWLQT